MAEACGARGSDRAGVGALSRLVKLILCLPIGRRRRKPDTMKTPSRTLTYVGLAVAAIVAAFSLRGFAMASRQPPNTYTFHLEFGKPPKYVSVRQPDFDSKLTALKHNGGLYDVGYKATPTGPETHPYKPGQHGASIKTDKVTTSEIAKNASADGSAANDPTSAYHLYSNNAADITAVMDTFQ
jgi:hypothetical protein